MIRLQAHPPSPLSKLGRGHTGRRVKRGNLLTVEGERGGGPGAESCDHAHEGMALYKSFNPLWTGLSNPSSSPYWGPCFNMPKSRGRCKSLEHCRLDTLPRVFELCVGGGAVSVF
jgi:hypothetical protein